MKNRRLDHARLASRLKHLVADLSRLDLDDPDTIPDNESLIGSRLGLDSLDATELAMCVEEEFGVTIRTKDDFLQAFSSITSLAAFIRAQARTTKPATSPSPATSMLLTSS